MQSLFGKRVIVSPWLEDQLRYELLPETRAILTPEYVEKFNEWSRDFFGIKPAVMTTPTQIICSERGYQAIKSAAKRFKYA